MDALIEWVWDVSYWHWWALAVILAVVEIVTPTTYFLWPAISAAIVGVLVAVIGPFDWRLQVLTFAVLAMVSTVLWVRWWRGRQAQAPVSGLNTRTERYLGRRLHLTRELVDGHGEIQLDDTWWSARSLDGQTLRVGETVEVVASDGAVLVVKPTVQPAP